MLEYTITPHDPLAHLFRIQLKIDTQASDSLTLQMPAWIPGSYMIRDFAKHLVTIKAVYRGEEINLEKLDKQTWLCRSTAEPVIIDYEVYAWDLSVRGAHLDATHGFFNGTSVFLRVLGMEEMPCHVRINPPTGDGYSQWRVATTLRPDVDTPPAGFGLYHAGNYRELIDHPVEMGTFDSASFDVAGVTHEIAITGRHSADMPRLCRDLERICLEQSKLFGELPVKQRYLFLVTALGDGYGGLEHRDSTALICKRTDLPVAGEEEVSQAYRQFLGLCSHEYFHLWNVKRITPKAFQESDLTQEAYSRLLWAFEGITSYFDDLTLVRCGLITADEYLDLLAQMITRVLRTPGRLKQSVSDSSFDAWTKFYKQDENAANAIVSYYSKGALIALALDLTIRRDTQGKRSLDDVMRCLWNDYGYKEVALEEGQLEVIIQEVTGLDLASFFESYVRGTQDLPLAELLQSFGVGYSLRESRGSDDKGGLKNTSAKSSRRRASLGLQYTADGRDVKVSVVFTGGAAQRSGVAAGDVITALDGIRVTPANADQLISTLPIDRSVPIHLFRRDELMQLSIIAESTPVDTCELWMKEDLPEDILSVRSAWLRSAADV